MATDRWKKTARLFEMALQSSPEERENLLREECGKDHELLKDVERLLQGDASAEADFLVPESQPSKLNSLHLDSDHGSVIGKQIGSFSVKSLIAKGGMGAVYLAVQEHPRREVALKIMTAGFWSASAEKRFAYETEILGRLHHPHIAQIYETGVANLGGSAGQSVPFFAMEFVPGAKPFTKFCDERKLDMRNRLKMFCSVCDAVHHAHQNGVIHRDLKPPNILVDENGHVKVIDFGIARSTDSDIATATMHTEVGQLLGTLAYMSPEQCAADPSQIDTATDVYSLGMILFEILTGRLAYDVSNMTIHAAARVICEREPEKPSAFDRRLRGDIETVVLKALEKGRAKRYDSAAALAADVWRFVNGEPIAARPATRWSKTIRWVARHPVVATTAVCIVIATSIGLGVAASLYYVNMKPDRLQIDEEHRFVRLKSVSGRTLHEWPSRQDQQPKVIECERVIERATEFGGGRLAIIGFTNLLAGRLGSRFCAFEIDTNGDRDREAWLTDIQDREIPPNLLKDNKTAALCEPESAMVASVFDDSPGDELILTFRFGAYSQRLIRIYDLTGKLIYQVWHDGGRPNLYWLRKENLLVCVALDEAVKDSLKTRLSTPDPLGFAVFAWRPSMPTIRTEFIKTLPEDATDYPIWYRYISPPATEVLDYRASPTVPPIDADPDAVVGIRIEIAKPVKGSITIMIDKDGNEVGSRRAMTDAYGQFAGQKVLPDPNLFEIRDDPPGLNDDWTPRG